MWKINNKRVPLAVAFAIPVIFSVIVILLGGIDGATGIFVMLVWLVSIPPWLIDNNKRKKVKNLIRLALPLCLTR